MRQKSVLLQWLKWVGLSVLIFSVVVMGLQNMHESNTALSGEATGGIAQSARPYTLIPRQINLPSERRRQLEKYLTSKVGVTWFIEEPTEPPNSED